MRISTDSISKVVYKILLSTHIVVFYANSPHLREVGAWMFLFSD